MENKKEWMPPVSFYFQVQFDGESYISDARFMEVSGLNSMLKKGGENESTQYIPQKNTHENIVLKRAMEPLDKALSQWVEECMEPSSGKIKTRNLIISLMDVNQQAKVCWFCSEAYPVKWELSTFDAMKNSLTIDSIEIAFNRLERKK